MQKNSVILILLPLHVLAIAIGVVSNLASWIIILMLLTLSLLLFYWFVAIANGLKELRANLKISSSQNQLRVLSGNLEEVISSVSESNRKYDLAIDTILKLRENDNNFDLDDSLKSDRLGESIQKLHDYLIKVKEADAQQGWIAKSLADFSSVLRSKNSTDYTQNIISSLVKQISANQGGLYFYQEADGEHYLELKACYAYGKKKHLEFRVHAGQGLLGQCIYEKEVIILKQVPKSYVKITSGLGEATPTFIVILPLLFNETFCGAIELACFEELPDYKLSFLKKVSEDIASEIVSVLNSQRTNELLRDSRALTEELKVRELEMNNNMQQLAIAQEEMGRKQSELTGIITAIDTTLGMVEFDLKGDIIVQNNILKGILGYQDTDIKNINFTQLTGSSISWKDVIDGRIRSGEFLTQNKHQESIWLSMTFTSIQSRDGSVQKVLALIQDVTQKKNKEHEFERLSLVANNTDNAVLITDRFGITEYVNKGFTKMTGYVAHEVIGKKPGHLLQGPDSDKDTIGRIGKKLKNNESIYEEILNYNKDGQPYWVSLAINPVFDSSGSVEKFISIQADITATKNASIDFKYKLDSISRSNAIIEFDTEGNILEVNDNFLNVVGYQRDEIIGKHHRIFVESGEANSPEYKLFWERLKSGEFISGEFKRVNKLRQPTWLKGIYNPILDIHGRVKKIVKFAVDLTEEKRLEQLAQRRQKELSSYLEGINNTIASAEFDTNGSFVRGNDIFMKVLGYKSAEVSGKNYDYFMSEDQANIMMWENLRLGKFFSGEFKMKDRTGKEVWLSGTFNPIKIDDDRIERIMMFAQFTTQEKEKLHDLNEQIHAFKAALPILEFNSNFTCKSGNEKALNLFGVSRLQIKSKTIFDFIPSFYHSEWNRISSDFISNGLMTVNLPFIINGLTTNYEITLGVVHNLEGGVNKVVMILIKEVDEKVAMMTAV